MLVSYLTFQKNKPVICFEVLCRVVVCYYTYTHCKLHFSVEAEKSVRIYVLSTSFYLKKSMEFLREDNFCRPKKRPKKDFSKAAFFIEFTSRVPSLKKMATVSLAGRLWNPPNSTNFMKEACTIFKTNSFLIERSLEKQKDVVNVVIKKLNEIPLPKSLSANVLKLINPMGNHLFDFLLELNVGRSTIDEVLEKPNLVHWTMEGTVNKPKSLDELIKFETSKVNQINLTHKPYLYKFACKYCLKEHISYLWSSLSTREQKKCQNTDLCYTFHLVAYWTAVVTNDMPHLMEKLKKFDNANIYNDNLTLTENMVSLCIYNRNLFALKYFWQLMEREEIRRNLINWLIIAHERHFDIERADERFQHSYILYLLLSQINGKQMEILQSEEFQLHSILEFLYDSQPLQKYFLPAFTKMLDFLHEEQYNNVLDVILLDVNKDKNLLNKIWDISPLRFKTSLLQDKGSFALAFTDLICNCDFQTIYILLNEASSELRKNIFFDTINTKEDTEDYVEFINTIVNPSNWSAFDELFGTLLSKSDVFSYKLQLIETYGEYLLSDYEAELKEMFFSWVLKSLNELPDNKGVIFDPIKIFTVLVFFDNYECVDKFMNWAFKTEAEALKFKNSLYHEDNTDALLPLINAFSLMGIKGWNRLEKLINYSVQNHLNINEFKNTYLNKVHVLFKDSFNLYRYPITFQNKLDFCNLFLRWSLGTDSVIIRLKNDLLLSAEVVGAWHILILAIKGDLVSEWMLVTDKLKWFCPSSESISTLKKLFITFDLENWYFYTDLCLLEYKKKVFIYLLDNLFDENGSCQSDDYSSYNLKLKQNLSEFLFNSKRAK